MKKILLLFAILFVSVITTACINNLAIQELNNKAVNYMDKGDTETAICRLKSSLDIDSEIYQTHYNLAVAYNSIGKNKEAIDELNSVIKLKPDFADAYYTMALSKEAFAFELIDNDNLDVDNGDLTLEKLEDFLKRISDSVDAYNEYLIKKPDAKETQSINEKIQELNEKMKEYTEIYDKMAMEQAKQVEKEL